MLSLAAVDSFFNRYVTLLGAGQQPGASGRGCVSHQEQLLVLYGKASCFRG